MDNLIFSDKNTLVMATTDQLREWGNYLIAEAVARVTAQQQKDREKLYSPREYAQKMQVTLSTLWRWRKAGILQAKTVGGKVYYFENSLNKEGKK